MQVSGLTAATGYYYRALCGGQATGSFQTAPGGGGSNTLFVAVRPPASWPSVTNAVAEFGPTSGLGGFTAAQSCATGCTLYVPATAGGVTFSRGSHRNPVNQTFAQSSIQAPLP